MSWIQDIYDFWFKTCTPEQWFTGGVGLDQDITRRFRALHAEMKHALPSVHRLDAQGHLAAVILFDQFPRNMFRNTAEAFCTDSLARVITEHALDHEMDAELTPFEKQFLYMPLMHSENEALQQRSVTLFATLGMKEPLDFAHQHKGVIDRFGRFPQRNAALGRVSTAEEDAFLKTTGYKW